MKRLRDCPGHLVKLLLYLIPHKVSGDTLLSQREALHHHVQGCRLCLQSKLCTLLVLCHLREGGRREGGREGGRERR